MIQKPYARCFNGDGVSVWGDENVLEPDGADVPRHHESHGIVLILCYVNFSSIKNKVLCFLSKLPWRPLDTTIIHVETIWAQLSKSCPSSSTPDPSVDLRIKSKFCPRTQRPLPTLRSASIPHGIPSDCCTLRSHRLPTALRTCSSTQAWCAVAAARESAPAAFQMTGSFSGAACLSSGLAPRRPAGTAPT